MTNAELFMNVFGFGADSLWMMSGEHFIEWFYDKAPEYHLGFKEMTNSEILQRIASSEIMPGEDGET